MLLVPPMDATILMGATITSDIVSRDLPEIGPEVEVGLRPE